MLNHAAWLEHENADIRWKHKKKLEEEKELALANDPVLDGFGGMRLSEVVEDETKLNLYLSDWTDFG